MRSEYIFQLFVLLNKILLKPIHCLKFLFDVGKLIILFLWVKRPIIKDR